jgi:iron only hydrogenase large subunit-like protein
MDGLKEASYNIAGLDVKVAVASGLTAANYVMGKIKDGTAPWTFVEIMCCPGGCINGGGQPFLHGDTALLEKRMKGIYTEDEKKTLRLSHENTDIKALYAEFLGEPGSEKAHELLHTHYHSK